MTMGALAGLLSLATIAAAVDFTNWSPPGPGDVRGPCPALNTLANHHILPHNGKGMTLDILVPALQEGLSVGPDFTLAIGTAALLSNTHQNMLDPYFDLNMIDEHDFPIEHDYSLSRRDYYFGDDHTFNQTIWNVVLSHFPNKTDFTLAGAVKARYERVQQSNATNPDFTYLPSGVIFSYGETALYLQTMGNGSDHAPYAYVDMFFSKQKLPYELGWRPSSTPITLLTLGQLVFEGMALNGEEFQEGELAFQTLFELVLKGFSPLTGQMANASMTADQKAKAAGQIGKGSKRWTA